MHIITWKRLSQAAEEHANARPKIISFHAVAKAAVWESLVDTRRSFPHADQVKVASGRTITVFNLSNAYRLITAIHYNRKRVYILRFLTHADYTKGKWKNEL